AAAPRHGSCLPVSGHTAPVSERGGVRSSRAIVGSSQTGGGVAGSPAASNRPGRASVPFARQAHGLGNGGYCPSMRFGPPVAFTRTPAGSRLAYQVIGDG